MGYRTKCLRCDMDISSKADICPYCRNDPNKTSLSAGMTDGERSGVQKEIDRQNKELEEKYEKRKPFDYTIGVSILIIFLVLIDYLDL